MDLFNEIMAHKYQVATLVIAITSLTIAFTGLNYEGVTTFFSETMFPQPDFEINSSLTPTYLPNRFRESLIVSPEYFIVTTINLKSEKISVEEKLQFSTQYENRGKK